MSATRRTILAGIAALPVAPAGALARIYPDARLLALYAEWRVSADESDRADAAWSAIAERMIDPEAPEALFRRDRDFKVFFGWQGTKHDDGRWWYGHPQSVGLLAGSSAESFGPLSSRDVAAFDVRREEILAAYAGWCRDGQNAREACGLADAEEVSKAAHQRNRAFRTAIALTPATTADGLLAKLRVAGWCNTEWGEDVDERVARDNLTDETMLGSAMRDLAVLDGLAIGCLVFKRGLDG